ncbi:uncharacterized protein LOC135629210 [Musa acuminata AAA Group]|uniref:(wild Malaysian banana) hypothetical protein n=1 Tax=Musa acuminata subsp. malaccensis TaxID=214687 RepID=A0A804HW99_MUSAM|nr:PREDICTED: uncharacterized protein LOC103974212 [Musa acuminata subsp. malaccensis]CAG1860053.1 unnamed protein product [Musa acuminata subsp. malaccensis]
MADEVPRRAMWAGLRSQLVKLTSQFFTSVNDYLRFRAVCKSWRCAVPHRPDHLPTQLPFLLLVSTTEPKIGPAYRLIAASAGNVRSLPNTANMLCIGSSFGWLILLSENDCLINLFNPVTAEDIRLPRLDGPTFADVVPPGDEVVIVVEKAVLSSDPTLDRDFVAVVFMLGVNIRWLTWRHGDESWTANANPDVQLSSGMRDVVPYGNRILCAIYGDNDDWAVLQVDPGPPARATIAAWYAMPSCVPRTKGLTYLVVSAGELLLAAPHDNDNRTANLNITPGYRVFRLEPGGISRPAVAVEVEDIHDRILFLSPSSSVSVSAEDFFGFPGNFIYFVGKDWREKRENRRVWLVVVQSLESGETTVVADSNISDQRPLRWRGRRSDAARWVTPNLRSYNR